MKPQTKLLGLVILIWILSMVANRVLALNHTEQDEPETELVIHPDTKDRHFTIRPEQWKK